MTSSARTGRHRREPRPVGGAVARAVAAGALVVGGALAAAATSTADPLPADPLPAPPVDGPPDPAAPPAAVPPSASLTNPLAQAGTPGTGGLAGAGGLPGGIPDLSGNTNNEFVLAQNAVPSAPGGLGDTHPELSPFNNGYLLEQNLAPAAPGHGVVYDVPAGQENAPIGPYDWIMRFHHMHVDGYLDGGMLGQRPLETLYEPLPGTVLPPGTGTPQAPTG
ncbi:hypothetical protein LV457_09020 [Mycobacterium sp. MYCO198283]|uniref:hypothetical protein n=1 Tax=Mycobacterium sp. MYCO198283 TaxID=2883505 RepID=UPI001E4F326C|nr:hypothetical protein [Mycobacterium sp. MYCO198283]MCG5432434.1 hypothetical protein [Mycobacterium sp. MYCO198283]